MADLPQEQNPIGQLQPEYDYWLKQEYWWTNELVSLFTDSYFDPRALSSETSRRALGEPCNDITIMEVERRLADAIARHQLKASDEKDGHFLIKARDGVRFLAGCLDEINEAVARKVVETNSALVTNQIFRGRELIGSSMVFLRPELESLLEDVVEQPTSLEGINNNRTYDFRTYKTFDWDGRRWDLSNMEARFVMELVRDRDSGGSGVTPDILREKLPGNLKRKLRDFFKTNPGFRKYIEWTGNAYRLKD